ncbi:hypothetical protein Fcan01_04509 [Folsomia candida]|uniref:Uncharacterized protein n=2 Tax=Folsomia candida TaxID=158441 RepID=A0A226EQM2_FOLCA|nr:hypothetical protein Fcan01_04509 [Folsomia candida]
MGLKTFRLNLTKSKRPWICRKLGKTFSVQKVICVILLFINSVQLSSTSSGNSSNSKNNEPLLSSSSSSLLINARTPRSIDDKFRVFKYVTEDEIINSDDKKSPLLIESKTNLVSPPHKITHEGGETLKKSHQENPVVPTSSKTKKNRKSKGVIVNKKVGNGNTNKLVDPVLKSSSAPTVTDIRSLIPNSFFTQASDPQTHNVEQVFSQQQMNVPHKNHHHNHGDNLQKLSSSHQHQENGNHHKKTDHAKAADGSPSGTASVMQTNRNNNNKKRLLAQNRNSNNNERRHDPNLERDGEMKMNSSVNGNETSLSLNESERSRRSPFGATTTTRGGGGNNRIMLMHQNHMPIMHQNAQRRILNNQNHNGNNFGVRKTNSGGSGSKKQKVQNNNRAALYNRNHNHHQNYQQFPVQVPVQHQYMQTMNGYKQVPVVMMQNNNNNGNRGGVAVVQRQKMDNILPSPSSDFVQYQTIMEEPTWNHPMYQRYKKVAKNMQKKVSGFVSRRPSQGRRDGGGGFRSSDFSKIPPIPLPRPRPPGHNGGRGVRSRPTNGPPPPPGRYSYPKSAQSIQDILNHFQSDNNDIDVDGPGPKGAGSRYPVRNKNSNNNRNHRDDGPALVTDLSGELKDVRFSLLRDIKEFAKRPMTMGDNDHNDDGPPESERYKHHKEDIPQLRSPPVPKPPRRIEEHDDDEDGPWRNKKHKKYDSDDRDEDPFSPEYNHESGFDDIFNPKPKPVRDMVNGKKSSRFRQSQYHDRDREESREKEYHSTQHASRKKDRPTTSNDRFHDSPHYYDKKKQSSSSLSRHDTNDEDSTERPFKDVQSSRGPSSPFSSSVEVEIDRKQDTRIRGRDRHRPADRGVKNQNGDDRDGDRSYLSSYEIERTRRPSNSKSSSGHHRRDREWERDHDYPKSIRDKLRDIQHDPTSSIEYPPPSSPYAKKSPYDYDTDTRLDYNKYSPPTGPYKENNKPIVLKRPYESYPTLPDNKEKKMQNHEFWNNYASATEKTLNGYFNPGNNLAPSLSPPHMPHRYNIPPHQHPAPPTMPTMGSMALNPYFNLAARGVLPTVGDHPEDILEIHTGQLRPPPSSYGHPDNSMQKAYLDLLQQKMHSDASLLNNQVPLPIMPPKITTTTRKTPTPMRMKIHIYPNEQSDPPPAPASPSQQVINNQPTYHQPPTTNNMNGGGGSHPSAGYYSPSSGGSSSYSSNTVPLLSPRYPQKVGGITYNDNRNLHLGPGPGPGVRPGQQQGMNHHHHHNNDDGQSSGDKNNNNNKNLVLHLHVHRRNDMGPVELEAEASDHFMSTDKPINYKEIYEDSNNQDLSNHASANNNNNNEQPEGDKSVSMEVPIHDDKIDDVLHTLLQLRNPSRKKRRK